MKTLILIMCAGQNKRWEQPTPKALALIQGEPNVCRTYRLVTQLTTAAVRVIVNEENKSQFPSFLPFHIGQSTREIDRFRNGLPFFKDYACVIFLYGDVVYRKEDVQKIIGENGYCFYGRMGKNPLTQKPFGEILGVSVTDGRKFEHDVTTVATRFEQQRLSRETGWEVYQNTSNRFVELSHFTDDYDTPGEYEQILSVIAQHPELYRI